MPTDKKQMVEDFKRHAAKGDHKSASAAARSLSRGEVESAVRDVIKRKVQEREFNGITQLAKRYLPNDELALATATALQALHRNLKAAEALTHSQYQLLRSD